MTLQAPLDPQIAEVQRRLRFDTPFWAGGVTRGPSGEPVWPAPGGFQGVVKIVNKQSQLVRMVPHPWQVEFDDLLEGQRAAGKPMRAIILKARKLGFSTWVAMKFLQRLTQMEYQKAIVTAQDTKTAGVIHKMASTAYSHLPTEAELDMGFSIKPHLIGAHFTPSGRKYLAWGDPSRRRRMERETGESVFEIDTAGSPEAGRGETPNLLHLSEVARWSGEQATAKMTGQLNAVPYVPETIVVLESTANGYNHFQRRYIAARDGAGDPDSGETYVALFVPWWRDHTCAMGFAGDAERERFTESIGDEQAHGEIAEDEPMLVELYDLTPEQLLWRRSMIRTQHEGSVQLFKQENPASDEEAFIGSGRTVFSGILVAKAIKAAESAPEPVAGTLRAEGWEERRSRAGTIRVPTGAVWVPSGEMKAGEHELLVWEHPRRAREAEPTPERPAPPTAASADVLLERAAELAAVEQKEATGPGFYVTAVDVAEGQVNTFSEGDFQAIQVFDWESHMQVAVHQSRMDIHEMPLWCLLIAIYYNRALLAIESNSIGIGVLDPLHKDYHYPRMYRRKGIDRLTKDEEKKPGWKTDQRTRPAMIETFSGALQEGTHGLRDLRTARQLSTFVYDERGRPGATQGEHDDLLMAAMIGQRVIETTRVPKPIGRRARRRASDPLTGY